MERIFEKAETDLWRELQKSDKTTLLWGMGNGADKILAVCAEKGIRIDGVFASDGFSRGQSFHGMPVLTYSECREKFGGGFRVLLAFGSSREDVLGNILKISREVEFYAPDVPVFGEGLFDADGYNAHLDAINEAFGLLADEESRRIFRNVIAYRLTGRIEPLFDAESDPAEMMRDLVRPESISDFADLGAYRGETVREMLDAGAKPGVVFAMEPDARNYKKTLAYAEGERRTKVIPIPAAAWREDTLLRFDGSGNRNASAAENVSQVVNSRQKRTDSVEARTLDGIVGDRHLDYIKFDVEGSEREALSGAAGVIRRDRPTLKIALYHRVNDLFELPRCLHREFPFYRSFFLRRLRGVPAWDLDLFVSREDALTAR